MEIRSQRQGLVLAAVALLVVAAAAFLVYRQFAAAPAAPQRRGPPPASVAAAVAERVTWRTQVSAVGSVEAVDGIDVTAEVSGKVSRIAFVAGDQVAEGALLVELDATSERAALRALEARLRKARSDEARARELGSTGLLSRADVEAAITNARDLAAQVEEQRAELAKKIIRAPFAGQVGVRRVSLGQLISPGDAIVSLQSVAPVHLNFPLAEQHVADVVPGQRVVARVGAFPDESFSGEVVAMNPGALADTRTFTVQALLPNEERKLRPGMFADVILETGRARQVIAVPATAVSYNAYGESVFKVVEPEADGGRPPAAGPPAPGPRGPPQGAGPPVAGTGGPPDQPPVRIAQRAFVRTGERRDLMIEIVDGVAAGEQVVTAGQVKLDDGFPIVIVPVDVLEGVAVVPDGP